MRRVQLTEKTPADLTACRTCGHDRMAHLTSSSRCLSRNCECQAWQPRYRTYFEEIRD